MIRRFMEYPPFSDLIVAEFTSDAENIAIEQAESCKAYLMECKLPNAEKIFAPKISMSFKGQDSYRYNILVKCPRGERNRYIHYLRKFGNKIIEDKINCNLTIDVNPYSTF